MKIGELPHREFSYCFLSDMPKCETGHTPPGFALCIIDMRECVDRDTPTGVLFR